MTSLEIQAFLTVQQTLSISRAAEQLYISQSSLSSRLQTLEQELGAPLFVRGRGRRELSLTAEGERFLPLARQHRALEEQMLTVAHPEPQPHLLRISTLSSIGNCLLPRSTTGSCSAGQSSGWRSGPTAPPPSDSSWPGTRWTWPFPP